MCCIHGVILSISVIILNIFIFVAYTMYVTANLFGDSSGPRKGQEFCLFSEISGMTVGLTVSAIHWVLGFVLHG